MERKWKLLEYTRVYIGLYREYIGIMEKKMETTRRVYVGLYVSWDSNAPFLSCGTFVWDC